MTAERHSDKEGQHPGPGRGWFRGDVRDVWRDAERNVVAERRADREEDERPRPGARGTTSRGDARPYHQSSRSPDADAAVDVWRDMEKDIIAERR